MRGLKWGKVALVGAALLMTASVWAQTFTEGKEYVKLTQPQPTSASSRGKVEVMEFFWYGCPHCYKLQAPMETWLRANQAIVAHRPQPAVLGGHWEVMGRAYHAMELAGGFDPKMHHDLFVAIHERREPLQKLTDGKPVDLYAYVEKSKGKAYAEAFKKAYESFAMVSLIGKDKQIQQTYELAGTPTVVINGLYKIDPLTAGGPENMIKVIDFVVKKEAEKIKPMEATKSHKK